MFAKFALRDLLVLAAAGTVWWLLAGLSAGAGFVADLTGIVAGLAVGVGAYLLHEWGHLLGAFASGSHVEPGASLRSTFVFGFDARRNSLAQFLVMSASGFAATGVALWVCYGVLPDDLLATRVARGAVVFLALLGVVLELPLVLYGLATRRVPSVVDVHPAPRA